MVDSFEAMHRPQTAGETITAACHVWANDDTALHPL